MTNKIIAHLVSPSKEGYSVSGKPGRYIQARPARLSIGGVIWESPLPRNEHEAKFFNESPSRINHETETIPQPRA